MLISGRGSNLKSLIEHSHNYQISAVFSNKSDAPGLCYAESAGIPNRSFSREHFPCIKSYKESFFKEVSDLNPSLIILAGFMMIIPEQIVNNFWGKIVNIHPSLLPRHPGLDTHRRALEAGDMEHGCSVHFVDSGVDSGPVISQASLRVNKNETPESLAEKILALEHCLYPWTINRLASQDIWLEEGTVRYSSLAMSEAEQRSFKISPTP